MPLTIVSAVARDFSVREYKVLLVLIESSHQAGAFSLCEVPKSRGWMKLAFAALAKSEPQANLLMQGLHVFKLPAAMDINF